MSILAIIPARSGSKRVLNKNIKSCGGKPLIAWTLIEAKKSKYINDIIISSDSKKILDVGKNYGVFSNVCRPGNLSGDKAMMLSVMQHEIKKIDDLNKIDLVVLLQPTSPLRKVVDIDKAIKLLLNSNADSVVSMTKIPDSIAESKKIMCMDKNGFMKNIDGSSMYYLGKKKSKISNNIYFRNGPAIVVIRKKILLSGSLYGKKTLGIEMPYERSIDINNDYDFKVADLMLSKQKNVSLKKLVNCK